MATVIRRAAAMESAIGVFGYSFGLIGRTLSSSSTNPSQQSSDAAAPKKAKRKKKKNLFEVAQFLPNWGIGYKMAKNHWNGVYYQITKINLYKDGRHGKAWGIFHKDDIPTSELPNKISGVHKRGWRYIRDSATKTVENTPKPEVQA